MNRSFEITLKAQIQDKIVSVKLLVEEKFMEKSCFYFRIIEGSLLPTHQNKTKNSFLVYSENQVIFVTFDVDNHTLEVPRIISKNVNKLSNIFYVKDKKVFLVPSEYKLEIWDYEFNHKVFLIQINDRLDSFLYIKEKELILIYGKSE